MDDMMGGYNIPSAMHLSSVMRIKHECGTLFLNLLKIGKQYAWTGWSTCT